MIRLVVLGLCLSVPAAAQAGATRASNTITPDDVARRIGIIAHDSMMGRDTPSPGLESTARYVAGEFRKFGLKPGGDNGTFIQRYPIRRARLDLVHSRVLVRTPTGEASISFADQALLRFGTPMAGPIGGGITLIGGPLTPDQIPAPAVKDRVIIWPVESGSPPNMGGVVTRISSLGARALLMVPRPDSARFQPVSRVDLATVGDQPASFVTVIELSEAAFSGPQWPNAAPRSDPVHRLSVAEFDRIRGAQRPVVVPLPDDWSGSVDLRTVPLEATSAPNVIGILEGDDPGLRREYVVFSAHMDHIGVTAGQADSINNGADDDASGTAGVLELAQAFAQRHASVKRSVVFMTVSGEEKDLWGSGYFVDHPTIPIASVVADLNIDMIGRNWPDTVVAIGMRHSDLGATVSRVAATHPELRMTVVDDRWPGEGLYFRSDHYNFARKGVPILFVTSGLHDDYHEVTDSPEKIDSEKEARLLRLLFFLGLEVGNRVARPAWRPESYAEITGLRARDSSAQVSPGDGAGIAELRGVWVAAYNTGDARSMEALYLPDAVRLPYDATAQSGRDVILAGYRASFAARTFTPLLELLPLEVVMLGTRALERGAYREILTPRRPGGRLVEEGKYVSFLERDAGGRWRYAWSMFNRDAPARQLDASPRDTVLP